MASLQRPITSVLGTNAIGATASYASGSKSWLLITTTATALAGLVAVTMSLVARYYRRKT